MNAGLKPDPWRTPALDVEHLEVILKAEGEIVRLFRMIPIKERNTGGL